MSRPVLLAIGAFAIAVAAVVAWRARQTGRAPLASLRAFADGARARDRAAIEQYLDVRGTAESVVEEASSAAATLPPEEATKSLMVAALEQSIWTALLDPAATDRFRGIADVRQQGDLARVGVRIRLADGDSAALVHLRMTRADAHWRVVGVEGLAPYMRSAVEGRYQRAYEAELRSDLRNLVTAQAVYFTDHAAYARSLAALVYDATPGVRVEILEASHDGWSAVARHRESSVECRVAIGTALPAGAVAGAVTCSGGG